MIKNFLIIFLMLPVLYTVGCTASNDLTVSTFRQKNPPPAANSPSGNTVFRISSGRVSSIASDSSSIKATLTPMSKRKYISGDTRAEFEINAKRVSN